MPVLMAQPALYDEMSMTASGWGQNQGLAEPNTDVNVIGEGHPMAAGLTGVVPVTLEAVQFGWGAPTNAATIIEKSTAARSAGIGR